jgi:adenylosuccinate synthase
MLRYTARVNGLTEIFLTKLDVLSGFPTLKICNAYRNDGVESEDFPPNQTMFHHAEPVYEEVKGWNEELGDVTAYEDLPVAAQDYVRRLEELVGVRISVASIGPGREQSLFVP